MYTGRWALKYFDKVRQAQARAKSEGSPAEASFDFNDLGPDRRWSPFIRPIKQWLLRSLLAFFRIIWPVPKFGRLVIVTRNRDVRQVLDKPTVFSVPYGREMTELGGGDVCMLADGDVLKPGDGGATFVLGLEGGEQKCQHQLIWDVVRQGDDARWLARRSRELTETLIANSGGRIDVMKDLVTRVAAETCVEYFGLRVDDTDAFAEWSLAVSALLFADPFGNPRTRQLGLAGAARLRSAIDDGLERAKSAKLPSVEGLGDTILARLVERKRPDEEIRAIMTGMITGFVPTTTLAAGNIIEELLHQRGRFKEAIALAGKEDREKLEALLFEMARLNPALNPGQWRYATQDGEIGSGLFRRHVPKGSVLMVSTASAMRGDDSYSHELVFGTGVHKCLGTDLAKAQITEILMTLFAKEELRVRKGRWGRIFRVGVFPRRLDMEFKTDEGSSVQSMLTILMPLAGDADQQAWRKRVTKLEMPARGDVCEELKSLGVVHFASINAIDLGDAAKPAPHLLLEVNGNGEPGALIGAFDKLKTTGAGAELRALLASAARGDKRPDDQCRGEVLSDLLRDHAVELKARPWGATGLCYFGLPRQSVASIKRDAELADFCRKLIKLYINTHGGFGSRAGDLLDFVRGVIRNDGYRAMVQARLAPNEGLEFQRDLIIPSRREPLTIAWKKPDRWTLLKRYLTAPSLCPVYCVLAAVTVALSVLCFILFGFAVPGTAAELLGRGAIALVSGGLGTLLLLAAAVAAVAAKLYRAELRDTAEDFDPDLDRVRELAKLENPSGFAQNHFLSVSPLKPGRFRKVTLGIALWGIELLIKAAFRPGFILNMGTIHFARWFRPPGSERLVFLSNYDGSWESYLEDFVTKAHKGQSAAWSNAVDFPRTRLLVGGGAEDGDRFKRWVRRQQKPTQFWFSRFPELTTDQIRNNAVIRWGLARAATDSQARAWLSNFGSMPKTDTQLETHEVQGIVFRGFAQLDHMKFVAIQLPDNPKVCAKWLEELTPDVLAGQGRSVLAHPLAVTFGDRPILGDPNSEQAATFVAFTASGFSRLGIPPGGNPRPGIHSENDPGGLATFPTAFNLGMDSRRHILGDSDSDWKWSDLGAQNGTHVALFIYAKEKRVCDRLFGSHRAALPGMRIICELDTQPTDPKKGLDYEHFGFRDGITQPVIRGTQRFAQGAHPRDIMEAGEFLLGYKSNQGFFPPTPTVARDSDVGDKLASVPVSAPTRYSAFQNPRPNVRDFGRNGTFLAVRQFEQYVDAFHKYALKEATRLRGIRGLPEVVGSVIDAEWVEAKLMGRWHDGTPLIGTPPSRRKHAATKRADQTSESTRERQNAADGERSSEHRRKGRRREKQPDTDLDFGVDDPQGLFCPFGAHVRRANPRGSLSPEGGSQMAITNRHRILRRGRSYQSGDEKGLLFVGICTDLERQFEFVQQSWLANPAFGGLVNEPDPIISTGKSPGSTFTIPTPAGPLSLEESESFVKVHGGGYFFLPSKSALRYLADLASSLAIDPSDGSGPHSGPATGESGD
jgi:Dyp-type peroxidase family